MTIISLRRTTLAAATTTLICFLFPLPSGAATANVTQSTDLAHWAANGGWASTWSVVNTWSGPLACTLSFRDPDGKAFSLNTSEGNGSSVDFNLAAGGSTQISAGGASGTIQSGSSVVSCPGTFIADVTYTWEPGGVPLTQVSVLPTGQFGSFVFAANANTGVALYGPGSSSATATVTAYDASGNQVDSGTTTVPSLGKSILNLNQLLTKLPNSFQGSVKVTSTGPLEATVLEVTQGANGAFVLGNVPVVGYDLQSTSSGTYKFVSGSLSGQSGSFSIGNVFPYGSGPESTYYTGTATIGSSSGTVTFIEMNNGHTYVQFGGDSSFPLAGGYGALTLLPNGGFAGSFFIQQNNDLSVGSLTGR